MALLESAPPPQQLLLRSELLTMSQKIARHQQTTMGFPSLFPPVAVTSYFYGGPDITAGRPLDLLQTFHLSRNLGSCWPVPTKATNVNTGSRGARPHAVLSLPAVGLPPLVAESKGLKRKRAQAEPSSSHHETTEKVKVQRLDTTTASEFTPTKDARWHKMYKALQVYKAQHGDCLVPRGFAPNPPLGSWVAEQRKQYRLMKDGKQSSISPERVSLLCDLEFSWNAQEAVWENHVRNLRKFKEENGHCHVPLNETKYPKLGLWVKEQRRHYARRKQGGQLSNINNERIALLTEIGFCWDTYEATWMERFRELEEFKVRNGNCAVPANYLENPKLGTWVHHQRRQYKKFKKGGNKASCQHDKTVAKRIKALDGLGFIWSPREK